MTKPVALVTGATGLVGRAAVEALNAGGWRVIPCARRIAPRAGLALDLATSDEALQRSCDPAPNLVVHLAAVVPCPSVSDNDASAALTRAMDENVSRAAALWGCPVVYTSGCSLYDSADGAFKSEASPVTTRTPYLAAKLRGESTFLERCAATVLRIPSVVGEGMPQHRVLARFLASALAGGSLEVWGSGTREQNFLWAGDAAAAIIAAAKVRVAGIYNVAGAQAISMIDLAELVVSVIGCGTVVRGRHADPRDGETARYDIRAAEQVLGWRPQLAVRAMIEWLNGAKFSSERSRPHSYCYQDLPIGCSNGRGGPM